MRKIIKNYNENSETVFNFNTLICTVYIDSTKYLTKKFNCLDDLQNAFNVNIERCEKRHFQYCTINEN